MNTPPTQCPNCEATRSFSILSDQFMCRRCHHHIPRTFDAEDPITRHDNSVSLVFKYLPREDLKPQFAVKSDVSQWARAAFETAQFHVHRREWEEAAASFYRAIESEEKDGTFIEAHLWIALLATVEKEKREHLEIVLANQPNNLEAVREMMILDGKISADADVLNPYAVAEIIHADEAAVDTETENLRCQQCGSNQMTTDDVTGLVECGSCGYIDETATSHTADSSNLTMALLEKRTEKVQWVIGERLLSCNSCGAERTIPKSKLSDRCPFCDSHHIIEKDVLGTFQQPDGLIPFAISKKQAIDHVKAELKGFVERVMGLFSDNRIKRAVISGVYLPFWVFDVSVEVRRTVTSSYGEVSTSTRNDALNNVMVSGVKSPPKLMTRKLGDYDFNEVRVYTPSLLAKHSAEIYSIDFDKASLEARSMVSDYMRHRHGVAVKSGEQVNVFSSVQHMSFRLILIPVWVVTLYENDGDIRTALVNGQTGKVVLGKARKRDN